MGVARDVETQIGEDLLGTLGEIRAAEGEPLVEGGGVEVLPAVRERLGRGVHRGFGGGDAGSSAEELEYRLALDPVGFLREVADGRIGRAERDGALDVRVPDPCDRREQRRLPGAVRADQADHVAGRDGQVEIGEERALAPGCGEAGDTQCCSHGSIVPGGHPPVR